MPDVKLVLSSIVAGSKLTAFNPDILIVCPSYKSTSIVVIPNPIESSDEEDKISFTAGRPFGSYTKRFPEPSEVVILYLPGLISVPTANSPVNNSIDSAVFMYSSFSASGVIASFALFDNASEETFCSD